MRLCGCGYGEPGFLAVAVGLAPCLTQAARCGQKLTGKFVKVSAVNDLNDAANAVPEI